MAIDGRSYSTLKVGNGTTVKIEYRDYASSTADIAKEYALLGYPDRYVVFTEHQSTSSITKTKLTPGSLDKGIFISLILRPSFPPAQAASLGLLSVVSLTQALEAYTTKEIGISWVNDVFCEGVKIGGTQIEGKLKDATAYDYIIVTFAAGIEEKNFPPRLRDSVKRVFEKATFSQGMMMAKSVLDKFFSGYSNINSSEKHKKYYENKFVLRDVKIKYLDKNRRRKAVVKGLEKDTLSLIVKPRLGSEIVISKASVAIIPSRIKKAKKKDKPKE